MSGPHGILRNCLAALVAAALLNGAPARAGSAVSELQLESDLGLQPYDLSGVGDGPVYNGSAIEQTITVTAGTTLSFNYNFLTNEPTSPPLDVVDDFAFVSAPQLNPDVTPIADVFSTLVPSMGTPYALQTGLNSYSITFAAAGTYNLGIGVVNVTDALDNSALLVDNLHFTSGSGTIVNGGFESGNFNGYSTFGDASIQTTYGSNAPIGTYQALITTSSAVPEPSSLLLLATGGLGTALLVARRRSAG